MADSDYQSSSSDKLPPSEIVDEKPEMALLPFHMGYLTPKMIAEAERDLNETEDVKSKALESLKALVADEKGFSCRSEDGFYLQFLRAKKFNVEEAFKSLRNYYMFRKKHHEIYDDTDPGPMCDLYSTNCIGFLPYRDNNGSAVLVFIFRNWNMDVNTYEEVFRGVTALLCLSIEDPATQVTGFRFILDFRGVSMKLLQFATPKIIMLLVHSTQNCFPGRYKGIHMLSNNKVFSVIWNIAYSFTPEKLKNRIFLHEENTQGLLEFIHPSVLPEDFGGFGPPLDDSLMANMFLDGYGFLIKCLQYGYM